MLYRHATLTLYIYSLWAGFSSKTKFVSYFPLTLSIFLYRFTVHILFNFIDLQYYLNVCRSLVTQYGLSCSGNTAACRAINGSITPENEQVKLFYCFLLYEFIEHVNLALEFGLCGYIADNCEYRARPTTTAEIFKRPHMPESSTNDDVVANWILLWSKGRNGKYCQTYKYTYKLDPWIFTR